MNKINDILEIVNASLKTHYFKDIEFNKLVELVEKNGIKTPCKYIGNGEYIPILEDTQGLIVYHRLISFDNDEDSEQGFGRNPLTTETYKINTVFYGNQNAISNDVKDINQYLALEFKKLIPRRLDLGVTNTISVSSINYDKNDIADSEGIELIPENVLFSLELQIVLKIKENCNDLTCATEPFKYCQDVTITDGVTVVEVEAGGTYTCTPSVACADATVNVNSILFSSVASGGLLDVIVVNENTTPVGTISIGGDVVVANSEISINSSLFASVNAEQPLNLNVINSVSTLIGSSFFDGWILPDITHTDSDGSPTVLPAQVPMVCTPAASQSGIAYQEIPFSGGLISRLTYDEIWQLANGKLTRTPPSNPLYIAELDYTSLTPFYTLKNNNAFGNKDRFTDENGLQVYGSNYLIDHLYGIGYYIIGGSADTPTNQFIAAHALNVLGYTDFEVSSLPILQSIRDYNITTPNSSSLIALFSANSNVWSSTPRPISAEFTYLNIWGIVQRAATTNSYSAIFWRKHY